MKPTVLELKRKKGARLAMLTAYDFPSARLVAEAGVDLILVGDSLGMVVLGYDSTLPVTVDAMVHHTKAARRGALQAFVIADLPFLSYGTPEQALANAARLMKDAGADSVKLEGGVEMVPIVEALVRAGVPVLGHVGLTPQTASALGGYKLQGKDEENARRIMEGAEALERAGCWSWGLRRSRAWSPSASASRRSASAPGRIATARCWCFTIWSDCSPASRRPSSSVTRKPGRRSRTPPRAMPPKCAPAASPPRARASA